MQKKISLFHTLIVQTRLEDSSYSTSANMCLK